MFSHCCDCCLSQPDLTCISSQYIWSMTPDPPDPACGVPIRTSACLSFLVCFHRFSLVLAQFWTLPLPIVFWICDYQATLCTRVVFEENLQRAVTQYQYRDDDKTFYKYHCVTMMAYSEAKVKHKHTCTHAHVTGADGHIQTKQGKETITDRFTCWILIVMMRYGV